MNDGVDDGDLCEYCGDDATRLDADEVCVCDFCGGNDE